MKTKHMLSSPFCIYGAGIVATSIYTAIKTKYNKVPLFFLISDVPEGKPDEESTRIDGIRVKRLSEWKRELHSNNVKGISSMFYLVAMPETHHSTVVKTLHSLRIEDSNIILFTSGLENEFMEDYYYGLHSHKTVISVAGSDTVNAIQESDEKRGGLELSNIQLPGIQVFQAKCHMDRQLQNALECPSYVYPIQVGAALTDQVITKCRDNEGDNISVKNRNYCELTAAYYAWKNSRAAYKGLCHYRRIFDINNEQMRTLLDKKMEWDVILPYPSVHYPNISMQHTRYIKDTDWKAMLVALKETAPDYFDAYNQFITADEKYFYNYNMLIARAEIFDDYCDFLFKVLERTEELTIPKGAERADRFAGYMGENLTTIYFHKNRDKLRLLYSGKIWLT